jgi:hypothetical protein
MGTLQSLRDAQPGQTVQFIYAGGSNPGSLRTLEVQENDGYSVLGLDKDKGEFRQFRINQASNVQVVSPGRVKAVYFVDARNHIKSAVEKLTGEQLAESYGKLVGAPARWNAVTASVEVTLPEPTVTVNGVVFNKAQLQKLLASLDN